MKCITCIAIPFNNKEPDNSIAKPCVSRKHTELYLAFSEYVGSDKHAFLMKRVLLLTGVHSVNSYLLAIV